jgi:hypothetical protein
MIDLFLQQHLPEPEFGWAKKIAGDNESSGGIFGGSVILALGNKGAMCHD